MMAGNWWWRRSIKRSFAIECAITGAKQGLHEPPGNAGKPGRIGWHPAAKVLTFPLPGAGGAEPRLFHHSRECQAMVKKVLTRRLRRTAGPAPMLPFMRGTSPPATLHAPPHRATPGNASVAFMRHQRRHYASASAPICIGRPSCVPSASSRHQRSSPARLVYLLHLLHLPQLIPCPAGRSPASLWRRPGLFHHPRLCQAVVSKGLAPRAGPSVFREPASSL
jgi:hypothetical protein